MCRAVKVLRYLFLGLGLAVSLPAAAETREWDFKVYLDDKEIGRHRFTLSPEPTGARVESRARFEVNFLFFTAYRYRHENTELWRDGCLQRIDARTDDNGDVSRVDGEDRGEQRFLLETQAREKILERDCVRSFAYWDKELLQAEALLNSQTGEYVPVELQELGRDAVQAAGKTVPAIKYRLTGGSEVDIALWYSPEDRWLALESSLPSGRTLRYRLVGE
jgi:hypothetical protein